MINWVEQDDGKVKLIYEEGILYVSKEDFNRAFGAILNASYSAIKRDFAI